MLAFLQAFPGGAFHQIGHLRSVKNIADPELFPARHALTGRDIPGRRDRKKHTEAVLHSTDSRSPLYDRAAVMVQRGYREILAVSDIPGEQADHSIRVLLRRQ